MDIRTPSLQVASNKAAWDLIDALMGGTATMRVAGQKYLPKWPAEDQSSYQMRLATATLFPAYSRTVSVLTGKPFSKPLSIGSDVPSRLKTLLDDVDMENRNLHTFAAEITADAMAYGLCGILIDCPPSNGARTLAEELSAGIRPYMVHIRPQAILGWRVAVVDGRQALTQLRLLETVEEDDGDYGTKIVEQVRLLEPGVWSTWRQVNTEWVLFERGVTTLPVIPFVPVYGFRRGFMMGAPPMLELAHANVEHWQSKSDQQTILHVARVPILFAKGLGDSVLQIGANAFIQTGSDAADLAYVEHSGAAIEAGRVSILDLEDRMRQIGAELLVIKPGNTTVAQTLADNEPGMCDLQRIMQSVEDALDQALDFMARWIGEPDGGHVSIYRDFGAATLAEASADLLLKAKEAGALSLETLLGELKRRGILSPDVDVQDEIKRAKAEAPVATTEIQTRI